MKLTAKEIAEAVNGSLISGDPETIIENITTDSHKLKGNDIFVPIKGARVDGHRFIRDCINEGAVASFSAYELSELESVAGAGDFDVAIIKVEDTMQALQALGAYYRKNYVKIPYVGVTGSVGKTTVREMIACALSAGFEVYSTKGNANSQSGVPITVTETDPEAGVGVIEMGISEFGEMSRISAVVQCDMAVFTVIGVSHIGNLGTQDNIMREKLHICDDLRENGVLILNGDDKLLSRADIMDFIPESAKQNNVQIVYYGTGENAKIRAVNITEKAGCAQYDLSIDGTILTRVRLSVPGMHMVLNSLAAMAAAYYNKVDLHKAADALQAFSSLDGRGKIFESKGITIINDAYNAAPQSMMAGLKVLDQTETKGRRIAVLADMLELGPKEADYHKEVGEYIINETEGISVVMVYGKLASHIAEGAKSAFSANRDMEKAQEKHLPDLRCFESYEELKTAVSTELKTGDTVLFKGSNSMKLGQLVNELFK